jgi:hypothetical protein
MTIAKVNLNELRLELQAANPTSVEGAIYYNSTQKIVKYYNGTSWISM